mmetsp:Transcript_19839/g.47294  ORF Transcript_19839/g.47294 Transcript_19839/m.47294 type:complete len:208 (-) Transcript_19839:3123-3746(-)
MSGGVPWRRHSLPIRVVWHPVRHQLPAEHPTGSRDAQVPVRARAAAPRRDRPLLRHRVDARNLRRYHRRGLGPADAQRVVLHRRGGRRYAGSLDLSRCCRAGRNHRRWPRGVQMGGPVDLRPSGDPTDGPDSGLGLFRANLQADRVLGRRCDVQQGVRQLQRVLPAQGRGPRRSQLRSGLLHRGPGVGPLSRQHLLSGELPVRVQRL